MEGDLDPHARRIAELAAKSRLPAMYGLRFYVEAGGLISYSADLIEIWRRGAVFVDQIVKGAKPADLPVEHRRIPKARKVVMPRVGHMANMEAPDDSMRSYRTSLRHNKARLNFGLERSGEAPRPLSPAFGCTISP